MASIRTRARSNGTEAYVVTWREHGRQQTKTFDDKSEADLLKRFLDSNGNSFAAAAETVAAYRSTAPTMSDLTESYIDGLTHISDGTRRTYVYLAGRHITPKLGALPVDQITRPQLARWMNGLRADGLSPKSMKNVHAILSAILTDACRIGIIAENPAMGLRPPAGTSRQPIFLTPDQRSRILAELPGAEREMNAPDVRLFRLLEGSGARFSEMTALAREDVMVREGRVALSITKAWKRIQGGYVIGPPKTRKSIRTVSLSRSLSSEVIPILDDLGPGDLLVRNRRGSAFQSQVWIRSYWTPAVQRADLGLPVLPRSHDLRHSHVSDLIAAGVPLPVIQARVGHESITTTIGTYGHLLVDADEKAADALD